MTIIKADIQECIRDLSEKILKDNPDVGQIVLVGIVTRGYPLALRVADIIKSKSGISVPIGKLDITLYRDDLEQQDTLLKLKETIMPEIIENKTVILIDDVIYHGRTGHAAMTNIMDYGRPAKIRLGVLVDRGHREFPICPDYTGMVLDTQSDDIIKVNLKEIDKKDRILINE